MTRKERLSELFKKEKVLSYEYRKRSGAYQNDKSILKELVNEGLIYQHEKTSKLIYFVLNSAGTKQKPE